MKRPAVPQSFGATLLRATFGCLLAMLSVAGCKVSSIDESTSRATQNECESDGDCKRGGGRCGGGICQVTSGEIEHLLLEIVPPMETSSDAKQQQLSSVGYLKALSDELANVRSGRLNLELNPIVQVDGTIKLPPRPDECDPPAGEPRATLKLRFTPSETLLGLPATTYSTDAKVSNGPSDEDELEFNVNVPPGRYDIYMQVVDSAPDCGVNSRLYRGRGIGLDVDAGEVIDQAPLELGLSEPSHLSLNVVWPRNDVTLDDWKIDIVDETTGLPISNRVTLDLEHRDDLGAGFVYTDLGLEYTPVEYPPDEESPGEALELVRLSPPESVVAPTIYIPRQALELFEKGSGTINHLSELPPVVSVDGQIVLEQVEGLEMPCARERTAGSINPCEVPMEVRIVAAEPPAGSSLSGLDLIGAGTIGYFEQTTTTNSGLTFQTELLPGSYRVIVVPELDLERPWASTEAYWSVSNVSSQHGKSVRVRPRARVSGEVRTPTGTGVTGFDVTMTASPEELTRGSFQSQLGAFPFIPRASLGAATSDGAFSVRSDYGTFDLSVRPAPETGFAWYVQPSIEVIDPEPNLPDIRLSWPVVYNGTVSSLSAGQLPGAVIRAYTYLDSEGQLAPPEEATSVLPVAETRADEEGRYQLLVPSRIGEN